MRLFTIAYNGEITEHHVFGTLSMAQQYLKDCGYTKIKATEWELRGIAYTSRAQILRIRSEKGLAKSKKQIPEE